MYNRRVALASGGAAGAVAPFGPAGTSFRQRCAKVLVASLPILFALASFDFPSTDLTGMGIPHTQGHPVTALPEEARWHIVTPYDRTTGFPREAAETWSRLPYPDMSVSIPPKGAGAGEAASGDAAWTAQPGGLSAPSASAEVPAPPAPSSPAPAASWPPAAPGSEQSAGGVGDGAAARRRRQRRQQLPDGATAKGAAGGPAAARVPPPDLDSCSISALAAPVMQVLKARSAANLRDLQRNEQLKTRLYDTVRMVQQSRAEIRQQLQQLDAERGTAEAAGEYGTAAAIRRRMDELTAQARTLESTGQGAQDKLDAIAEAEASVRLKEAGQLLWLSGELRGVAALGERTIERLRGELAQLRAQIDTVTETRASIGQALSDASQSGEVRRELRALAEAAAAVERAAAEELQAERAASHAVLYDDAALAANLTAAKSMADAESLELALLRGRVLLALQIQDYDHAERLSAAIRTLEAAQYDSVYGMEAMESLRAEHEAVVRQRLSDFRHYLASLYRASQLVQSVQDLRGMYDSDEVDDREALELASQLAAAVAEVRAGVEAPPPRVLRSAGEAAAVVRQLLSTTTTTTTTMPLEG